MLRMWIDSRDVQEYRQSWFCNRVTFLVSGWFRATAGSQTIRTWTDAHQRILNKTGKKPTDVLEITC